MKELHPISKGSRELLSSRLGFILMAAGCAIGLGNVWRFPYITGEYGGAIFVGVYILCLLFFGIPCVMLELSLGRATQKSVAGAFEAIERPGTKWHWAKYFIILSPLAILCFYSVLTGWLLYYVVEIAKGDFAGLSSLPLPDLKAEVSNRFASLKADAATMMSYTVIVVTLGILIVARGVQKGVEAVTRPLMLLLLGLLIGLAIYSLTLDNAWEGVKFYLYPDIDKVNQVGWSTVIFAALNQAFFSLTVGQGSLLIFGSYIKKERALAGEATIITILDTSVALIAGLIVFPVCFSFGIAPNQGPDLLFNSMLTVFASMEYGRIVGTIFFVFMFFAAFTSVITVIETMIAPIIELFKISRRFAVFISYILITLSTIPCVLGFNYWSDVHPLGMENILAFEDFILSNNFFPIGAFFLMTFVIWGWGVKKSLAEVNTGKGFKVPLFFRYYIYLIPFIIALIFVLGYKDSF